MLIARPEEPADYAAIRRVNSLAFGQPAEADLVDALRTSNAWIPGLSLVAEVDGDVIGHILFSRIHIEAAPHFAHPALALAPMAVIPAHQRQGVGAALVREGLAACKRLGETIVIVLGHPEYYPRFGFVPASRYGVLAPFAVPDEAFMAQCLIPNALDGISGTVRYSAAFDSVKSTGDA